MGRPPIQHHKHVHVISFSPEVEETVESLRTAYLAGKGIRGAGEALKGVLSHPVGLAAMGILIGGFLIAFRMPGHFDRVRARDEAQGLHGVLYPDEMAENVASNVTKIVNAAEGFWNWLQGAVRPLAGQ